MANCCCWLDILFYIFTIFVYFLLYFLLGFSDFCFWQEILTYDLIAFLLSECLKWPLEAPPALCTGKLFHHCFPSFCCLFAKEWKNTFFFTIEKTFDFFKRLLALSIVETYPEMFTRCVGSTN